jgi:hypothetical protein
MIFLRLEPAQESAKVQTEGAPKSLFAGTSWQRRSPKAPHLSG